jgi:hypothetical protein
MSGLTQLKCLLPQCWRPDSEKEVEELKRENVADEKNDMQAAKSTMLV